MVEIAYNALLNQKFKQTLLEDAVHSTLKNQSVPQEVSISILLTDDEEVRALNRQYRGFDAPTDVLSFDVHERDPETGLLHLGEIAISIPYAAKQAQKNRHPLEAEVQLLIVHGVLHLLGHDHVEAKDKEKMWHAQQEILTELGLAEIKISQ